MQNFSNKKIINNFEGYRKILPSDIPENLKEYNNFFLLGNDFKNFKGPILSSIKCPNDWFYFFMVYIINDYIKIVAEIFRGVKDKLEFPIGYEYLEAYLTDFKFKYIGYPKGNPAVEGVNGFYTVDGDTVNIFYSQELSEEDIRFTIVHELFHSYQHIDQNFNYMLDNLIKAYEPHSNVVRTLLEETTDFATAIYLMPAGQFYKKLKETNNIYEVSNYFKVPMEAVMCRLKVGDQII